LLAWYPGQEGGEAIVDVLLGDAEPGGRMPTTWARAERDTPSFLHYPGEAGVVRYGEELHVGYRWYDARAIEPMLPFGHGGSYTEFAWGEPSLAMHGDDVVVEVPVTNVGTRQGSEVVQVYVAALEPVVVRPPKQLAAFAKVHVEPGETEVARIVVRERAFARWDVGVHDWVVDPGAYDLVIAASAVDERFRLRHEIA
jgi:beta-glucosidase